MKKTFKLLLLSALGFFSVSCDWDHDHDDHDHDQIEKVVITVTNRANSSDVQTITYLGGTADRNLTLVPGRTYGVSLDFQKRSGSGYVSMNSEIIAEKEKHFITYDFANANITILRANDDVVRNDGKKIGLRTEWTVNTVSSTSLANIKLNHSGSTAEDNFPSASNQLGRTTGGETDANITFNVR